MLKLYGSSQSKSNKGGNSYGSNTSDSSSNSTAVCQRSSQPAEASAASLSGVSVQSPTSHSPLSLGSSCSKRHPGEIRLQKELEELDLPPQCRMELLDNLPTEKLREGSEMNAPRGDGNNWLSNEEKKNISTSGIVSWVGGVWGLTNWRNISDIDENKGNEIIYSNRSSSMNEEIRPGRDQKKNFLLSCILHVFLDEGFWREAKLKFLMTVPIDYPHVPPKVKCMTKIYHPNIDFQGNICLNILREDWKPVLSLSSVIYGVLHLFLEPNPNDPLNEDAAKLLRDDPVRFSWKVSQSLRGYSVDGEKFECLI